MAGTRPGDRGVRVQMGEDVGPWAIDLFAASPIARCSTVGSRSSTLDYIPHAANEVIADNEPTTIVKLQQEQKSILTIQAAVERLIDDLADLAP